EDNCNASLKVLRFLGDPTPKSLGGTKKFLVYEMMNMKMMGAIKARISVPSICRQKTIINVFWHSVHVCRTNPIAGD
ncbi:hypothetical protein KC343_g16952, partial [Hortaea werneckii]